MSTKSPTYQVLVLRGVFAEGAGRSTARKWFRDDNFRSVDAADPSSDWVIDAVANQGTLTFLDWDSARFAATSAVGAIWYNLTGALTNTFPYLVVRSRRNAGAGAADAIVACLYTVGSESFNLTSSSSWTIQIFALTAGKTFTNVELAVQNTAAQDIDFIFLCQNTYLLITNDVLAGRVNLSEGAESEATFTLLNNNAKYWTSPNRINQGDVVMIWFNEGGVADFGSQKNFGGYISGLRGGVSREGKVLHVTARGWGTALEKATISVSASAKNDETYVGDVIQAVNNLGWSFGRVIADLYASALPTDIGLDDRRSASDALTKLADWLAGTRSQNRGAVWRVTPSGLFQWGDADTYFPLDGTTRTQAELNNIDIEEFSDHVINALYLVGKVVIPAVPDRFTESDAANWTATLSNPTASDSTANKLVGANSLKITSGSSALSTQMARTLESPISGFLGNEFFPAKFRVIVRRDDVNGRLPQASLRKSSDGSSQGGGHFDAPDINTFYDTYSTLVHLDHTGFDQIALTFQATASGQSVYFDNLRLEGFIVALAYDNASINKYGRREGLVVDFVARTTREHRRDARGHLRKWNNSLFEGSATFDGYYFALPGDRLDMTLPDYNQTAKRYRIRKISHSFPNPLITTITVTDNLVTFITPRSAPDLATVLREVGITIPSSIPGMEVRLRDVLSTMSVVSDEIGASIT